MRLPQTGYTFKITCLLISLSFSLPALAQIKTFKISKKKVSIHYPKNWQFAYNFLSSPLTLFGPMQNDSRPVITISDSRVENYKFNENKLEKDQKKYQKSKIKWLKKNYGSVINFIPYKKEKWSSIKEVHSIGVNYEVNGKKFKEMSYFFSCHKKLHNSTTLITLSQDKKYGKTIKKMMDSIKCY